MNTATACAPITEKVLRAHCNCARKSYLLMFSRDESKPNEYALAIEHRKELIRANYLAKRAREMASVRPMSYPTRPMVPDRIADSAMSADILKTEAALFHIVQGPTTSAGVCYEPVIFTTSHAIRHEDKVELCFAGYVLSKIQDKPPPKGKVILLDGSETTVRLLDGIDRILPAITVLKGWGQSRPEPPAVILNKHCPYCEFQHACKPIAEKEDNISLLGRIGDKELRRYGKKGIFTIKQLSFLYRPKRQHKRSKARPVAHNYELQALALRTGNIYLHGEPVVIPHGGTEIYLDIEALPDRNFHYLIGLIVCSSDNSQSFQLWANCQGDEASIWNKFAALINKYPACPVFHYGNFERRAIQKMGKLYGTPIEPILKRLFNVNTCIFGKVYFPVRSNSLKDICRFLGLSWTSHNASGLQSVAWRYQFEHTGDQTFRRLLLTYNHEDCENLRCLTAKLRDIAANGTHSADIRFADIEGGSITDNASGIVGRFNKLLQSAHGSYEQAKIVLKKKTTTSSSREKATRSHARHPIGKINKIISVRPGRTCPRHPGQPLRPREKQAVQTITDLVFTARGAKKVVTQYVGKTGYCAACNSTFTPPAIRRLRSQQKYGRGLQAWAAYHRMALRLPFDKISQLLEDMFCEKLASSQVFGLVTQFSRNYVNTEKLLLNKIMASPIVHVDETTINIQGSSQYVWVITDGQHVVFRQTESREASIIHELFDGYSGVLCSDFYAGYDSVKCLQQKCWAHLIRDLNDDLRKSPFDAELETFVSSVRDLIVPIFEAMERYGQKLRRLRKFRRSVDHFYARQILAITYRSDLMIAYQKRFVKYRDKLFVFLERDGVPWNNNMAERALRHIAVQRKISGSFGKAGILQYLLLLGITQSCRFQNKALLQFLLSGERDVDRFKGRRDFDGWRMR